MKYFPFEKAIDLMMYVAMTMRSNIAFIMMNLSHFANNLHIAHWQAVKRIYQYFKGTQNLWLIYGHSNKKDLIGYDNADGNIQKYRHTISGYAFILNGSTVSQFSKYQEIIVLSTTESEHIAEMHIMKEALWMQQFISEVLHAVLGPMIIYSGNQSAIALTKDQQFYAHIKHIDIHFYFIHWHITNKDIQLIFCLTANMIVDCLTESLLFLKIKHSALKLKLIIS